jgi:hypothetical protein
MHGEPIGGPNIAVVADVTITEGDVAGIVLGGDAKVPYEPQSPSSMTDVNSTVMIGSWHTIVPSLPSLRPGWKHMDSTWHSPNLDPRSTDISRTQWDGRS